MEKMCMNHCSSKDCVSVATQEVNKGGAGATQQREYAV